MSRNIYSDPFEVVDEDSGRVLTKTTHRELLGLPAAMAPTWIGWVPLRPGTLLMLESPYDADVRHKYHVVKVERPCSHCGCNRNQRRKPTHLTVGRLTVRRVP